MHAVLDVLERAGITAWVDGGWGVDALVGSTTRTHSDLDLVVPLADASAVRRVLADAGYRHVLRDLGRTALALTDDAGHEVDLHWVTPTADGGADQEQPDGTSFHYGPPVTGTIADRPVRCADPDTQVRAHLGYPPTAKDRHDLATLHTRLGVPLPPTYAGEGGPLPDH